MRWVVKVQIRDRTPNIVWWGSWYTSEKRAEAVADRIADRLSRRLDVPFKVWVGHILRDSA